MTEQLPELLDAKRIMAETGMSRAVVEKMMRGTQEHPGLPIVQLPGIRKVYVYRRHVAAYIDAHTFAKDQVQA